MGYATKQNQHGFSLVELSVVLIIISVVLGLSASIGLTRIAAQKITLTKQHMQLTIDRLVDYAQTYNHLPCPAGPTLARNAANEGVGLGTNVRTTNSGTCTGAIETTSGVVVGTVPYKMLGMSFDSSLDGWDNRLTYIVDEDLTFVGDVVFDNDNALQQYGFGNKGDSTMYRTDAAANDQSTTGSLTITDDTSNITTGGAFVIISHGPNKFGSYPKIGGARFDSTGGSANEDENTDDDGTFIWNPISTTFDDLLLYKVMAQII